MWTVDLNNPFKNVDRRIDTLQKFDGFPTLGTVKEESAAMTEEFGHLFNTKSQFTPGDWHSLFHELIAGDRLKFDEDDIEEREDYMIDAMDIMEMFIAYAFRLCHTNVAVFQSEHDAEKLEIAGSDHSVAWLAANRLLGSAWQDIPEDVVEERQPHNPKDPPREPTGEPADENGKDPAAVPGAGERVPGEITQERMEQLGSIIQRFATTGRFHARLQINQQKNANRVLAVACNTRDQEKQHSSGISTAARTDYLLATFEVATGFMKTMNALELWSITQQKPKLELVHTWSQEELKAWDITETKAFPTVSELAA